MADYRQRLLYRSERIMAALDAKYCGEEYRAITDQIAYIEREIDGNIKTEAREHALYLAGGYTPEEFAGIHRILISHRDKLRGKSISYKARYLRLSSVRPKEAMVLVDLARE